MKNTLLLFTIIVILLSACSGDDSFVRYDCNFYEQIPAPSWVKYAEQEHSDYYFGKGMAHKNKNGFQSQFEEAYNAAVEDMARSIQTMVENIISRSSSYHDGVLDFDEVKKLSTHYTKILLRGHVRSGQWVDQKSCTIWIQVRARKKNIDALLSEQLAEKKKLDEAGYYANKAKDNYYNPDSRLLNLKKAENAIKEINFEALLPGGLAKGSYDYYALAFSEIRKSINNEIKRRKEAAYRLFISVKENIKRAKSNMASLDYAKNFIDEAGGEIAELERGLEYSHLDIGGIKKDYFKILEEYEFQKGFVRTLRIGMSKLPPKKFGSPEKIREEFWGSSKGYKYGYYWLIYKDGFLDCVVKEADFKPYGEKSLYDCYEHREKNVKLLMD